MNSTFAVGLCAALTLNHLASIAVADYRLHRRRGDALLAPGHAGPVSIVIPSRGIEAFTRETLEAAFSLNYADYELIFCIARADDPVAEPIRAAIAAHPEIPARLLNGDERISDNPKLNNCVKGWDAARHDWIILADSNVLMPPDYIERLLAAWRPDTGMVCTPPIGARPQGLWANVECAFLNTLQARWQYAAEAAGMGFAQGKSMLWRRQLLEAHGGIRALAADIAEDAAATKLVRGAGFHVHVVDTPFEQPLGARPARQVWLRQLRWARLRRVTFPALYAPEILAGAALPAALAAGAMAGAGLTTALACALAVIAVFHGAELAFARRNNWSAGGRMAVALLLRDALMPALWLGGWIGATVVWRDQAIKVKKAVPLTDSASLA